MTIPVDLPEWQSLPGVDLLCHEDHIIRMVPAHQGKNAYVCVMEGMGVLPEPFCASE
ncbi:MAG TPA: hypothetical protein VNY29_06225 [Terriglobales bacterium]|nr:hypothetical protein [Terriglobales bacterium]